MSDYIERDKALAETWKEPRYTDVMNALTEIRDRIRSLPPADVQPIPPTGIGDMSDGYHTFNQLYYQRMMLFATIVKQNRDRAWKSLRHEDGELCFGGGWFIVGIDTPEGSYTYHYENKYFDLFDCEILDYGKRWDGHTEKDVTRLLSLPADVQPVVHGEWIPVDSYSAFGGDEATWMAHGNPVAFYYCSHCKEQAYAGEDGESLITEYCPNCGAKMDGKGADNVSNQ